MEMQEEGEEDNGGGMMKVYRKDDFKDGLFWEIFIPGYKPGETEEDVQRRTQKLLDDSGIDPIAETDKELHCGDTVDINGEFFHIGICGKSKCAVDGPLDFDGIPDGIENEGELICPYCGCMITDTFELSDDGDLRCIKCGSLFHFEKEIEVTWSSYPVEAAEIKKI